MSARSLEDPAPFGATPLRVGEPVGIYARHGKLLYVGKITAPGMVQPSDFAGGGPLAVAELEARGLAVRPHRPDPKPRRRRLRFP